MKTALFTILIAFCILGAAGCARKAPENQPPQTLSAAAANVAEVGNIEKRPNKAPNFSWKDTSGKTIDLAGYSDKLTVINFWATWCGPCKHELPDLISLQTEYAARGVKLIGVSADVGANVAADVRSFVQEHGINYPVVIANDDLKEAFGNVNMLPTTFITDKDGNILTTLIGARSKAQFAEAINGFLK